MSSQSSPNIAVGLLSLHKVVSRGLDVSITNSRRFQKSGFPDGSTQNGFLNYVQALTSILHGHHSTEDELAFPYFRDLLPKMPIVSLISQHQEMIPMIESVMAAVKTCRDSGSVQDGLGKLSAALSLVHGIWHPHIQVEEEHFRVDTIGKLLTPEEHLRLEKEFGKHSQEHTGPPFLTVPFMLYNLPADSRGVFSRSMPPEVTGHLVPVVWKEQWASMKPFLLEV